MHIEYIIEYIIAAFAALQVANIILSLEIVLRKQRPTIVPPAPPAPAAPVIAASAPSLMTVGDAAVCRSCGRVVARFTLTDAGPVCANCKPIE